MDKGVTPDLHCKEANVETNKKQTEALIKQQNLYMYW